MNRVIAVCQAGLFNGDAVRQRVQDLRAMLQARPQLFHLVRVYAQAGSATYQKILRMTHHRTAVVPNRNIVEPAHSSASKLALASSSSLM